MDNLQNKLAGDIFLGEKKKALLNSSLIVLTDSQQASEEEQLLLTLSGHQDTQNKHVAPSDSDANQQAQMIQPKPEDQSACGEKGREHGVWWIQHYDMSPDESVFNTLLLVATEADHRAT